MNELNWPRQQYGTSIQNQVVWQSPRVSLDDNSKINPTLIINQRQVMNIESLTTDYMDIENSNIREKPVSVDDTLTDVVNKFYINSTFKL